MIETLFYMTLIMNTRQKGKNNNGVREFKWESTESKNSFQYIYLVDFFLNGRSQKDL